MKLFLCENWCREGLTGGVDSLASVVMLLQHSKGIQGVHSPSQVSIIQLY